MEVARGTLLLACFVLTACRATDPAYFTSDGRKVKSLRPVYYRIALAPVAAMDEAEKQVGSYRFFTEQAKVQQELLQGLQDLDTTVTKAELFRLELADASESLAEARNRRADLLIRPRLAGPPQLGNPRPTERAWASGGLWFVTWIGGLHVEDRAYDAIVAFDFELVNPHDGQVVDTFHAASDEMSLTFKERNLGRRTLTSFFVPPSMTKETPQIASESLSKKLMRRIAAIASRHIKDTFTEKEVGLLGEIQLAAPQNGALVDDIIDLDLRLVALEPITEYAIYFDGMDEPVLTGPDKQMLEPTAQRRGSLYMVPVRDRLRLGKGKNVLVVEFRVAGRLTSRTLVFFNGTKDEATP